MRYASLFIDRVLELSVLEREYGRDGFSFIVVYGRRRIGKTRLLREWIKGKKSVYFVATQIPYSMLSSEFAEVVGRKLGVFVPTTDIIEAIDVLNKLDEKIIVVLDEFQYIVEADPSFPSRLMKLIDRIHGSSRLKIVICGSAVSFFERKLLGYKAPLFGRRTLQLKIRPLKLVDAWGFFKGLSYSDILRAYSIVGGTPAYLNYVYGSSSLREIIHRVIEPGSPLLDEAPSFLRQELREPRSYMALLTAIAQGRSKASEAASIAGIDPRNVGKYIDVLEELDIVIRRTPLGFKKGSRIFFKDDYFRFWFKFIPRLRSFIETGYVNEAIEYILGNIDEHSSYTFTRFIEEHLPLLYEKKIIPVKPVDHGPWWYRDLEIDLIVREPGRKTVFIEAKWSNISMAEARRIINKLIDKAGHTGLQSPINYFMLFIRESDYFREPLFVFEDNIFVVNYSKLLPLLVGSSSSK